ncbi:MAG TPA: glycine zipper domain-containing protein [Gemmatimonadaceae bacterium]|nr:glycine zipper domain-containing protein [Gemmatimonadaceae bacterium]
MDRNEAHERERDELEARERSDDARPDIPDGKDHAPEAIGGVGGALGGAAIGSIGGPVGAVIGAIAGALGGWWAGHAAVEAEQDFAVNEARYQERYETSEHRLADRRFDDVRHGYLLGHAASMNPDYAGRDFDEVEEELRRGWSDDLRTRYGDWTGIRSYAREAYVMQRDRDPNPGTSSVTRAAGRARDRLSSGRSGLTSDDTVGY